MPLSPHELAKTLAAGFEVGELVEARARRREQDHLPAPGRCARPRERPLELAAFAHRRPAARQRRGDQRARPRRSDRPPGSSARTASRRALKSWPLPWPPRIRWIGPPVEERVQRDERARDVGRLGVVDVQDAVAARDLLQAVRDAREGAQAVAHRVGLDSARQADRGRGHRVLDVVRAAQAQLADGRAAARSSPPQLPRARSRQVGARRRAPKRDPPRRAAPRSSTPALDAVGSAAGATAMSSLPWRAKIAQLGRTVGLDRPVAVEVVGGDVQQHRRLGREARGVLELEGGGLADDRRAPLDARRRASWRPCRRCPRPRPAGRPRGGCARSARPSSSCRWSRSRR